MTRPETTPGIRGTMSRLYDVFVDWDGRLARELPGLEKHLASVGARKVLDLGCGTGRHVAALAARGYDVHGADVSDDMLAQARALVGAPERLHAWRMGEPLGDGLRRAAPFDALVCMGSVWPQVASESAARAAASAMLELLRPGGIVVLGLKAFAHRRGTKEPSLPILKREHEGRSLWFVRFVDFTPPPLADGTRVVDLHMAIVAGDALADEQTALHHGATRVREWAADELATWLSARGFVDVHVSGKLGDPTVPATTEDVFASARKPAG
ncbi:MAG: class I SAM-dependent methyltransferase [Planctomycetes bacterium]|nr:class I SAM-dependent methyltransferase [Planctomycetota bacterium]